MTPNEAKNASLAINNELFSLSPSALITMFEIDITDLAFDQGLITDTQNPETTTVFRFHNSIVITRSMIVWRGLQYIAAPIQAQGFEVNSKGTLPTPKLGIYVDNNTTPLLNVIKQRIAELNGLVGAKVTRIRTFARYLDAINFSNTSIPNGFSPDPNIELPRDIYYIDRKSNENKYGIEFELASILDVEGLMLPGRVVLRNRCPWQYRGFGCLYEYESRRVDAVHGAVDESTLPLLAIAAANDRNEKIYDLLGSMVPVDRGKWSADNTYSKGHQVYIEKNGIKYYFVAKNDNTTAAPPNLQYWIADQCAKDITACKLRWRNINDGILPFGGFPAVGKAV